jgi:hypothetical protein
MSNEYPHMKYYKEKFLSLFLFIKFIFLFKKILFNADTKIKLFLKVKFDITNCRLTYLKCLFYLY